MHGVLVSCTEHNTKIRVPVQPGVYGIQHGAECVHDVVQTANYSAMRLHYSAGKLHGWFTLHSHRVFQQAAMADFDEESTPIINTTSTRSNKGVTYYDNPQRTMEEVGDDLKSAKGVIHK